MELERFVGAAFATALLVLLGDGVVAGVLLTKTKAQNAGWVVITLAWGLAVFCGAVVAGPVGATMNPAFDLANGIHGGIGWDSVLVLIAGDMVGGFVGAAIVVAFYWDHFKATEDQGLKLAVFSTAPNIRNYGLNFFCEAVATFVLVFVNYATAAPGSGVSTIGLISATFIIMSLGMSLGPTTGYAMNPARDLSPRIAHFLLPVPGKGGSDWAYAWVPVLGPIVGAVAAAFTYQIVFTDFILKALPAA